MVYFFILNDCLIIVLFVITFPTIALCVIDYIPNNKKLDKDVSVIGTSPRHPFVAHHATHFPAVLL